MDTWIVIFTNKCLHTSTFASCIIFLRLNATNVITEHSLSSEIYLLIRPPDQGSLRAQYPLTLSSADYFHSVVNKKLKIKAPPYDEQ